MKNKVETAFRNSPGVEDSITAIVAALGCRKNQAVTLCKFGYRSVDDLLNTPESEIRLIPRIGKGFLSKWAEARRVHLRMQALDELAQMTQDLGLYDECSPR